MPNLVAASESNSAHSISPYGHWQHIAKGAYPVIVTATSPSGLVATKNITALVSLNVNKGTITNSEVFLPSSDGKIYGRYPSGDAPIQNSTGNELLTLLAANDGNPNYKYWSVNDNDTTYKGAFRLPTGDHVAANADFNFADHYPIITLNGSTKMFVAGRNDQSNKAGIAEVNIPVLSTDAVITNLNTATISQNFYNPLVDAPSDNGEWGENGYAINGMGVVNNRLVVNYYARHDTVGTGNPLCDQNSLVLEGTNLNSTGLRGFFTGTEVAHYSGWISEVPTNLQNLLGATFLYGNSSGNSRSINSRNSVGPSLFGMDMFAAGSITSATPPTNGAAIVPTPNKLLDYPLANALTPEADMGNAGTVWTHLSEAFFGFIIPNTKTYMVIGESGGHANGVSYGIPPYNGSAPSGYYPITESDVDTHYWLYNVDDIVSSTNSYDPQPYEHGSLSTKFSGTQAFNSLRTVRGGAFDSATSTLYLSVNKADDQTGDEDNYPLIIAYDLTGVAS